MFWLELKVMDKKSVNPKKLFDHLHFDDKIFKKDF